MEQTRAVILCYGTDGDDGTGPGLTASLLSGHRAGCWPSVDFRIKIPSIPGKETSLWKHMPFCRRGSWISAVHPEVPNMLPLKYRCLEQRRCCSKAEDELLEVSRALCPDFSHNIYF